MPNELFQARLPDDFADRIHEYRESRHMTKSEAIRHLLRAGLEAEQESAPTDAWAEQVEETAAAHADQEWDDEMHINKNARLIGAGLIIGAVIGLLLGTLL